MKKKKLNLAALEVDDSFEILDTPELQNLVIGGSGSFSIDCVLKAYDYLDGNYYNYNDYVYNLALDLGYTAGSTGGVYTSDIPRIGTYGHMNVTELTPANIGANGIPINGSTGLVGGTGAFAGSRLMMTFNGANGADHAVIVTGTTVVNGVATVTYYDPVLQQAGTRASGDYVAMYAVGDVGTASGPPQTPPGS